MPGLLTPRRPCNDAIERHEIDETGKFRMDADSENLPFSPVNELNGELALSIFPGVGLLDTAFRQNGFCVCESPDLITGGDIRRFHIIPGRMDGVIGGSPCQGFSTRNRHRNDPTHHSVINSIAMLQETCRVITEAQPEWFVIENVPCVPDIEVAGYTVQRCIISDHECGGRQLRTRCFQFGSKSGHVIRPERVKDSDRKRRLPGQTIPTVDTKRPENIFFPEWCRRQGLSETLKLPGWTQAAKFKAVGNGVPLALGRTIAAAVRRRSPAHKNDCACGCGRTVSDKAKTATDACRHRIRVRRPRVNLQEFIPPAEQ